MATVAECAWTAGIIDGEGTITVVPRKRTDNACVNHGYSMRVQVSNTDQAMILKLKSIWGGSFYLRVENRERRSDVYHWTLAAQQGLAMLKLILPYLVTKSAVAKVCMEFQESLGPRGTYRPEAPQILRREELFAQVKQLNRRGRKWQIG